MYITQRQAELRAEAAAHRMSRKGAGSRTYRIRGLHLKVGALLIVVGRSLCEEERNLLDPAR